MLGLDPSTSGKRFSGLRCAAPENDAPLTTQALASCCVLRYSPAHASPEGFFSCCIPV